ncbi:MAG: response regulator transcription factor [Roseiflexaceae bacterium]|nr:response regulator transcription factor [Roseiflexaceae bacterium]
MQTILLVEDALDLAQAVGRELTAAGFRIVHAADGVAALEAFAREQPDLVVLDWMLPRLDGLEVLKRLRQGSTTPVLMLTARAEEADLVIGLELGADDYLAKPFGNRELVARVKALLRRNAQVQQTLQADQTPSSTVIMRGGLQLDSAAHNAMLDGQPLELTPTEWNLLDLLLRNPGRAFSRDYLLDAVWGQHYVGSDRSVDNAMLRLRKKLGTLGDDIETVWGIGYRLRPEREA